MYLPRDLIRIAIVHNAVCCKTRSKKHSWFLSAYSVRSDGCSHALLDVAGWGTMGGVGAAAMEYWEQTAGHILFSRALSCMGHFRKEKSKLPSLYFCELKKLCKWLNYKTNIHTGIEGTLASSLGEWLEQAWGRKGTVLWKKKQEWLSLPSDPPGRDLYIITKPYASLWVLHMSRSACLMAWNCT